MAKNIKLLYYKSDNPELYKLVADQTQRFARWQALVFKWASIHTGSQNDYPLCYFMRTDDGKHTKFMGVAYSDYNSEKATGAWNKPTPTGGAVPAKRNPYREQFEQLTYVPLSHDYLLQTSIVESEAGKTLLHSATSFVIDGFVYLLAAADMFDAEHEYIIKDGTHWQPISLEEFVAASEEYNKWVSENPVSPKTVKNIPGEFPILESFLAEFEGDKADER